MSIVCPDLKMGGGVFFGKMPACFYSFYTTV